MAVLEGYSVSQDSLDPAGVVAGVDAGLESNGSSFLTLAVKLCFTVSHDLARQRGIRALTRLLKRRAFPTVAFLALQCKQARPACLLDL